jgi:hypothetical protein
MVIDHYGIMVAPDSIGCRLVGRIAFPIFAFLVAEGAAKTRDPEAYLGRMFVFGLLSQLPFDLALPGHGLNIFFTLGAGLVAIRSYQSRKSFALVGLVALAAQIAGASYGGFGVLCIFLMHQYRRSTLGILCACLVLYPSVLFMGGSWILEWVQPFAVLALPLIMRYNVERGPGAKWLFYAFYPAHLVLLYVWKTWGVGFFP